jgi:hypothetical protein
MEYVGRVIKNCERKLEAKAERGCVVFTNAGVLLR